MSQVLIQSPKHCANKGRLININKFYKKLFFGFSTIFTTLLSLILLIWLILRPTKPHFSLKQADFYQFNLSSSSSSTTPNLLFINSSIQITLLSNNPNQKVGIYYDKLQVYAAYKGHQISLETPLPPFYQGHQDSNFLTASLVGTGLPLAPSLGYQVGRDRTAGKLVVNLKVNGRLRWKVGTWVSGQYRFNVNCVAVLFVGPTAAVLFVGPTAAEPLTTKQAAQCSTTV